MRSTQLRDLLLLVIGSVFAAQGASNVKPYNVEEACNGLGSSRNSTVSWTYADCVDVWTRFTQGFDKNSMRRSSAIGIWRKTADELRRKGSPCLLVGSPPNDGMGSTTIRILYSWIFAEEMGCDWVTPDWGESRAGLGSGEVKYCHPVVPKAVWKTLSREDMKPYARCTTVDLLEFFNFRASSVDVPEGGTNMLQLDRMTDPKDLVQFRNEFWAEGSTNKMKMLRSRVLISVGLSVTTASLASIGSWGTERIRTVHNVLQQARDNFNKFPRPSFDVEPQCDFDPTRLNIAIHVRMGDRRVASEEEIKYFKRLEDFMASVTGVVVERGLQPPLFRIFTETTLPCPDPETGLFEELPLWPVKLDQAQACHDVKAPDDCPDDSRVQGVCIPERDGIFYVQDKPMAFHLNPDIRNALSCMIKADGIVMGCSTFGQIAGILSQGISFFSLGCDGDMTGAKSRMTPGLAVADKGYRWVPVNGSWLDPALYSTDILRATVEEITVNQ